MKYIEKMHELKVFHKKDVVALTGNENAAKEILRRYKKQALLSQVRRDLYVSNHLASKMSLANTFEIASQITPSSYLAYHTALAYHGLAHQLFNEVYVSSVEAFSPFEFEGMGYVYCQSKSLAGVVRPVTDPLVCVTDLERTVVDCIDRIDLSGGLEELVACVGVITYIDEAKLLGYLRGFGKQALYQKAGFILAYFQKEMQLSEGFFACCKANTGKSVRYLTHKQESDTYFKEWGLCAPQNILSFLEQGGSEYV